MPAAAVIPAPIAYIKVVAVKKLVVGSRRPGGGSASIVRCYCPIWPWCVGRRSRGCSSLSVPRRRRVYFEKIRVLKAGLDTLEYSCME